MLRLSLTVMTALAVLLPTVSDGFAGDRRNDDRKLRRHHHRPVVIIDRSPAINVIPGTGTYSGSITVYHVPGMGTSTWLQGVRRNVAMVPAPVDMKIIAVDEEGDNACSYENGVCVIRPRS